MGAAVVSPLQSLLVALAEPPKGSSTPSIVWIALAVAGFGVATAASWSLVLQVQRRRASAAPGVAPVTAVAGPKEQPAEPLAPPAPAAAVAARGAHAIFVCYRRADSADVAGRIFQELDGRFGRARLFKDVDAIALGRDFREAISEAVQTCAVMLAVIGPAWVTATNDDGDRRLDDTRDHVRAELEAALSRAIPVIPVLVQGARVPPEAALPPVLASLAYRNSIEVRPDPDFHNDMDRLMRAIAMYLGEP